MTMLREAVIKLAHEVPELRPLLIPLLRETNSRVAFEFDNQKALEKYHKEHPGADMSNHWVAEHQPEHGRGDEKDPSGKQIYRAMQSFKEADVGTTLKVTHKGETLIARKIRESGVGGGGWGLYNEKDWKRSGLHSSPIQVVQAGYLAKMFAERGAKIEALDK